MQNPFLVLFFSILMLLYRHIEDEGQTPSRKLTIQPIIICYTICNMGFYQKCNMIFYQKFRNNLTDRWMRLKDLQNKHNIV